MSLPIKLKVMPKFPTQVVGDTIINVEKVNGVWTFTVDTEQMAQAALSDVGLDARFGSGADQMIYRAAMSWATTTITAYGRSMVAGVDAPAVLTTLGVSPYIQTLLDDANAGAALTTLGVSPFVQTILDDDDAAAVRTTISAQQSDAELTAIAGLVSAADRFPYFTGPGTAALGTVTSYARTLLDDTTAAGARTTLGAIGGVTGSIDNAALRADGTGGATAQASPLLIADTTGALSRSGGGGIPVQGTNTNDSAAAGVVGEYVFSDVPFGSAISLTSGAASNLTSISLTPGDWDVSLIVEFFGDTTTTVNRTIISTSTTSATNDGTFGRQLSQVHNGHTAFALGTIDYFLGSRRFSLSTTTTIYGVVIGVFGVSTMTAFGHLSARRVR